MKISTHQSTAKRNRKLIQIITSIIATLPFVMLHNVSANDYLDELAMEAESTANVSTSHQLSSAEQEQLKEMEDMLAAELPTTYGFYEKLYPKNKEKAFKHYAHDKSDATQRLSHLQKKVMDLYFEQ